MATTTVQNGREEEVHHEIEEEVHHEIRSDQMDKTLAEIGPMKKTAPLEQYTYSISTLEFEGTRAFLF
jgi:predicted MarR family transcription regulator